MTLPYVRHLQVSYFADPPPQACTLCDMTSLPILPLARLVSDLLL